MNSPNNLQLACLFIGSPLALLVALMAYRNWLDRKEIRRLERQNRKAQFLRQHFKLTERGFIATDFMRGIAEACTIFLLLASVLGWWFYNGH